MSRPTLIHGDFTGLASDYSKYRPGYSESVLTGLLALVGRPPSEIDAVDVGAGTGIWTRMLAGRGLNSVVAVEPNDDMRAHGVADSKGLGIEWAKGNGEETGRPGGSADFLSMASSFHWVDFDRGVREFHRVLRPGGVLAVLEFGLPAWQPARFFHRLYTERIMPFTATLVARDRSGAYRYLPRSVDTFLTPEGVAQAAAAAGFGQVRTRRLTFGTCAVTTALRESV